MSHLARGLITIQVIGIGPNDAISLILEKAFDNVLFLPDKALHTQKSETPALRVEIKSDAALIGPLTISGKAGCGSCASRRLAAAEATRKIETQTASQDEFTTRIVPVLRREIEAILNDGPEHSDLLDHVLAVDLETLDESLHKIIPLPHCAVCGGASAFLPADQQPLHLSPEDSPEVVLGALAGWIDRRTGVISDLFIEPPGHSGVSLPIIAMAAPPHVVEEDGSLRRLPIGWGKGLTISGAVLSAVGEAVERYSASLIDYQRVVWKRPHELEGEILDPRAFGLYTDEQYARADFPYVRFDSDIPHPWVLGNWADSGQPVWVPALFVFLSIDLHQEQLICDGTSNGLAASLDNNDASLRAILELVERDAFMASWLTARSGQRVDLDNTLDLLLREVLEGIESLGASVEIYTLPTSVIGTTVLCLARGDGDEYPGVTFGLACDLDPQVALRQAILELGQTGPYLRRMMRSGVLTPPKDPASVREMLDHAAYYFPKERANAFDRMRNNNSPINIHDLKNVTKRSLETCVSALKTAGLRLALVDVTAADVATGPFRVMRAVSPDLQPIWYGYGLERTIVERIRKLGLADDIPPINPIW